MSRATFEAVYSALFAKAQAITGLTTVSRRLQSAQEVSPENSPALFQVQGPQKAVYQGDVPTAWELSAMWVVVVVQPDTSQLMTPALNALLDAATQAIAPASINQRQTLGGLVEYAAIAGAVDIYEGDMGDRAVAFVPIRLVVGGF